MDNIWAFLGDAYGFVLDWIIPALLVLIAVIGVSLRQKMFEVQARAEVSIASEPKIRFIEGYSRHEPSSVLRITNSSKIVAKHCELKLAMAVVEKIDGSFSIVKSRCRVVEFPVDDISNAKPYEYVWDDPQLSSVASHAAKGKKTAQLVAFAVLTYRDSASPTKDRRATSIWTCKLFSWPIHSKPYAKSFSRIQFANKTEREEVAKLLVGKMNWKA